MLTFMHETLMTTPKVLPRVALKVVAKAKAQATMTADTTRGNLTVKPHRNDVTAHGTRSSLHATDNAHQKKTA